MSCADAPCARGSDGAAFVLPLPDAARPGVHEVRGAALNDFCATDLAELLAPWVSTPTQVGVWTEAKITCLAYELATPYPHLRQEGNAQTPSSITIAPESASTPPASACV